MHRGIAGERAIEHSALKVSKRRKAGSDAVGRLVFEGFQSGMDVGKDLASVAAGVTLDHVQSKYVARRSDDAGFGGRSTDVEPKVPSARSLGGRIH